MTNREAQVFARALFMYMELMTMEKVSEYEPQTEPTAAVMVDAITDFLARNFHDG